MFLHIDGDAFFASCEQARNPALQGVPVVTGKERGIASSLSYEAKALGARRAMKLYEIKKLIPHVVVLPSDYETYSLLSERFYKIVRRYTSEVEEYGIDECFADITGMDDVSKMTYESIARQIQTELQNKLGFTFSVGLSVNKVLAKMASKWQKPHGLTVIAPDKIFQYLAELPVEKVWGIGPQTCKYLTRFNIFTALELAMQSQVWAKDRLDKPFYEIWQELNGQRILQLQTGERVSYQSMQKFKTFTPPSGDEKFVFAQVCKNIENVCIKARRHKLNATGAHLVLRTQKFDHTSAEILLSHPTALPHEVVAAVRTGFRKIFSDKTQYRATGVSLVGLQSKQYKQLDLFTAHEKQSRLERLYEKLDEVRDYYGKHTLFLATSFSAHRFSQHTGDRGDAPLRQKLIFPGETKRRRLNIPVFLGEVG